MKNEVVNMESKTDITKVLKDTYRAAVEGLTGLARKDKKEMFVTFGEILQRTRGMNFLNSFQKEWEKLREEGRIKEDYGQTNQGLSGIQEILNFIDNDCPDETRFRAVKSLFFSIATEEVSDRNDPLPSTLIKIIRQLDSSELISLFTAYRLLKQNPSQFAQCLGARPWCNLVAREAGYKHGSIVENAEYNLMRLHLIGARMYSDQSGYLEVQTARLTSLAVELCKFIEHYDPELINPTKNPTTSPA